MWLSRLVALIANVKTRVVSGFAWMVVLDSRLSSFVLASMANDLITLPRLPFLTGAWGGSTAIERRYFEELRVLEEWRGCLSDDLQLTNVIDRAGGHVTCPPDVLPIAPVRTSGFGQVFRETRRWYLLFRHHMPIAYFSVLATTTFVALGWITAGAETFIGDDEGAVAIAAGLALGILKSAGRAVLICCMWGNSALRGNLVFITSDVVAPLASTFSAICGWFSLFQTRTTWAGITYEIRGPRAVKILFRKDVRKTR